jgi:hypothetical protein
MKDSGQRQLAGEQTPRTIPKANRYPLRARTKLGVQPATKAFGSAEGFRPFANVFLLSSP